MTEPRNMQEYMERSHSNHHIEGHGVGNVYNYVPCPFCAAPDFMVFELLEVHVIIVHNHTCKECHRSAKVVMQPIQGGTVVEIVQTGGPEQPDWLEPKLRREV